MPDIRDRYTLDASHYLNSMQKVVQATKAQADMAREASYQATIGSRRAADAAREAARVQKVAVREAARVQKVAVREAAEAERVARKEGTDAARQAAEAARQRAEQAKREYEQQARAAQKAREAELRAKEAAHEATRAEREATEAAKEQERAQEALSSKIKGLVATYVSLQSVAKLVQLSDEYSSINAKLGMMEDRLGDTKAMQDAIMASAKRSRASYMDTANLITRLGIMASDAFGSFDELVAFSEQINKNFVLSGATATEASAATLQLSQALASGTLRGEELNSVMSQAPAIALRIADYLDIDKGKIRELASEGAITAEIVKNAMLETAEETNAAFESMPMTWSQVWTQVSNTFIEYSQPLLEVISFLAQHFDALVPIIAGVSGALLAYVAIQGAVALATTLSTIATQGLWATIMANPIAWIAVAIGVVIALIAKWVQSVGGLKVAWLICVDGILTAFEFLADGVQNTWSAIKIIVAGSAAAVAMGVQNLINGVIDKVNSLIEKVNGAIGLLNSVPGINLPTIPLIGGVSFGTSAANSFGGLLSEERSNYAARNAATRIRQVQRQTEIKKAKMESTSGGSSYEDLYGYLSKGIPSGASMLGSGGGGKGGLGSSGGSGGSGKGISSSGSGSLGKIAADTADIKKSVEMTHEDLSLLVDMATRKYVANVNLETRAPVINITGQNTGDSEADAMRIADELKRILLEQMSSGGSLSYALP